MNVTHDISFRASDGTDPDRVRTDIELLNQRMSVLAANIQLIANAVDSIDLPTQTVVAEKVVIAPGGGLIEKENGVQLDILGLPIGSSAASGWLVVEGNDGNLYRVPTEDFIPKPAIEDPNSVPTLEAAGSLVSESWSGDTTLVTRNELYGLAATVTTELGKIRAVLEPSLQLLRTIGSNGNS